MRSLVSRLVLTVFSMSLVVSTQAAEPGRTEKPLRVVVFGGHPDDPESGAGGLIAKLTRQGHEVILAYGTAFRGGRRFFDRPEADVRREEATAACKVLARSRSFFRMPMSRWRRTRRPGTRSPRGSTR